MRLKARKVGPLVGQNPIARAVAREGLRVRLQTVKIRLHVLQQGEECADLIAEASWFLAVLLRAMEISDRLDEAAPLKTGLDTLMTVAADEHRWQVSALLDVSAAIEEAQAFEPSLKAQVLNQAIHFVDALEHA